MVKNNVISLRVNRDIYFKIEVLRLSKYIREYGLDIIMALAEKRTKKAFGY